MKASLGRLLSPPDEDGSVVDQLDDASVDRFTGLHPAPSATIVDVGGVPHIIWSDGDPGESRAAGWPVRLLLGAEVRPQSRLLSRVVALRDDDPAKALALVRTVGPAAGGRRRSDPDAASLRRKPRSPAELRARLTHTARAAVHYLQPCTVYGELARRAYWLLALAADVAAGRPPDREALTWVCFLFGLRPIEGAPPSWVTSAVHGFSDPTAADLEAAEADLAASSWESHASLAVVTALARWLRQTQIHLAPWIRPGVAGAPDTIGYDPVLPSLEATIAHLVALRVSGRAAVGWCHACRKLISHAAPRRGERTYCTTCREKDEPMKDARRDHAARTHRR